MCDNYKLLVIGQLPPPVHGSNVMTETFVKILRKLDFDVITVEKTFNRDQKNIGRITYSKLLKIPIIAVDIVKQILLNKPILCFYFSAVNLSSFLIDFFYLALLTFFKVPYVLYIHGKGYKDLSKRSLVLHRLVKWNLSKALGAMVLGNLLKSDVDNFIPESRLFVIPNAIPDCITPTGKLEKESPQQIQVLFLSNLIPAKGPLEFLKVADIVLKKADNVRFVIGGGSRSPAYCRSLLQFVILSGLQNAVFFKGPLFGEDKARVLSESHIFVFPSSAEASPLVIIEAMQYGLPVITTDQGSIPEMIQQGLNGYLFNHNDIKEMADAVITLVNDQQLRTQMSHRSRKVYEERYTMERYEDNVFAAVQFFLKLRE